MNRDRPIRVLHVLGALNRGGVETWLIHVLRNTDRRRVAMDFLVHSKEPAAYDGEAAACGATVHRASEPKNILRFAGRLFTVVRRGHYDAVHSHTHHFSGVVLLVAALAGARVRVAHSHTAPAVRRPQGALRQAYLSVMKKLLEVVATHKIGCSVPAAASLFGDTWEGQPRTSLLYCGIDLSRFAQPRLPGNLRMSLGVAPTDVVIGHVGRFIEAKNHAFLLDIAASAIRMNENVRLLLVGDGPLMGQMIDKAASIGIADRTVFAGPRSDVSAIMLQAIDVFVLPSLFEGLPLVLLEAQAAGLPVICSEAVTEEADAVPGMVDRVPLSAKAEEWAEIILQTVERRRRETFRRAPAEQMRGGAFDIHNSVVQLEAIYSSDDRR